MIIKFTALSQIIKITREMVFILSEVSQVIKKQSVSRLESILA